MRILNHSVIVFFLIVCLGLLQNNCRDETKRELTRDEVAEQKELLIRANKYLVKKDVELIERYIERRNWNMEMSETGLFYEIYEKGTGAKAISGDLVTINFDVNLLDGTRCYSSDELGPKNFRIERSQEESGLEQGVLMMREGDKARFIIPPHLAHGLLGDENKIPPRSVIVYQVELLKVINE